MQLWRRLNAIVTICLDVFYVTNFFFVVSGISSSFSLNSSHAHLIRRVVLPERKRRDSFNCRRRELHTRNQGTVL